MSKRISVATWALGFVILFILALTSNQYTQGKDITRNAGDIKTLREVERVQHEMIQRQLSGLKEDTQEIKEMLSK